LVPAAQEILVTNKVQMEVILYSVHLLLLEAEVVPVMVAAAVLVVRVEADLVVVPLQVQIELAVQELQVKEMQEELILQDHTFRQVVAEAVQVVPDPAEDQVRPVEMAD
jgi:hypothetical protein